jgi:hypothetical protein
MIALWLFIYLVQIAATAATLIAGSAALKYKSRRYYQ